MGKSNAITYIRHIAKTRTISAAADELGISQPALSTRLKRIEEDLGAPLFDRSRTPLVLTEAGKAYLDYADKVDLLDRELEARISDLANLKVGKVVIGGASSFNRAYLPTALATFSSTYPGVEIEVVEDTVPNLSAAAIGGRIDLIITPSPPAESDFELDVLCSEKALLCVPRSWSLVSELPESPSGSYVFVDPDDITALKDAPFIMLHPDQQVGQMMRALFERCNFNPQRIITVDQMLTALALAEAGAGVSLATEGALRSVGKRSSLACYFIDIGPLERTLFVARPANRATSRAALEFARILQASVLSEDTLPLHET